MNRSHNTSPTLVLIHAFPFHAAMWEPQCAALAGAMEIYTPDLPGFGGEARLDGESFSMGLAAEFIGEELTARGIERCVIGGLSMGGYVAFECWRRFPERIAGLVLADTKAAADTEETRRSRFAAAERIGHGEYARYVDESLGRLLSEKTRRERPEVVEMARSIALGVLPETAIAALLGMAARADSTEILSTISVPTSIIVGAEDLVTTVEEARRMAEAIPNATLTIIPDAGHLSNLEQGDAFNAAVLAVGLSQ